MKPRSPLVRRTRPRAVSEKRRSRHPELRYSTVARSKKPIRKNAKRAKREKLRAYGPQAFMDWLHDQPCVVGNAICRTSDNPIHAHHVVTGGMGRKASADQCVPLCSAHHRHVHILGRATFEAIHKLNLQYEAARTQREFAVVSGARLPESGQP